MRFINSWNLQENEGNLILNFLFQDFWKLRVDTHPKKQLNWSFSFSRWTVIRDNDIFAYDRSVCINIQTLVSSFYPGKENRAFEEWAKSSIEKLRENSRTWVLSISHQTAFFVQFWTDGLALAFMWASFKHALKVMFWCFEKVDEGCNFHFPESDSRALPSPPSSINKI